MITISEYKKRYIDRQGQAKAVLLNKQGEGLYIGDVHTVTNNNGRLKCKWRVENVPLQWHSYTHIALLGNDEVVYLEETTPINFDGKPSNLWVTFYE